MYREGALLSVVILFMTITNTEHAPTSGTAIGLATSIPINSIVFVASAAVVISIVRVVLHKQLHNLI